jgi:hypothetical protein
VAIRFLGYGDPHRQVSRGLAWAFLAGPWTRRGLITRGREALDQEVPWLPRLVARVMRRWKQPPLDAEEELVAMVAGAGWLGSGTCASFAGF